ncbi:MAG: signal recognition particle-docking protein FtsY [Methanomassiliicoccales archaeon]|nr:signal recognition particle-docking protein FtsY [Methanomassiliicoccales archaeon]
MAKLFESLKQKLFGWKKKATELPESPETIIGDSGRKISENVLDEILWDLEIDLLESDVALPVVEEIKKGVRDNLVGKKIERGYAPEDAIELALKSSIEKVLKRSEFDFDQFIATRQKPVVLMFVGINGTGKTTAIAKIAHRLQKNGMSCVLAASDTFRAGAIEQLGVHAERLNCKIVKHKPGSDPAAVAFDAVEHAKARKKDVVLIDTAGRMQTNVNLMDEMKKIKRVVKPDLVIFVGDALAGNDAIEQAATFDKEVGIDAVILTKIDADAKGGAALSIAHAVNKPIAFLSTGQGYDDLIKFDSKWMVERLFAKEPAS